MKTLLLLVVAAVTSGVAWADQCEVVSPQQASAAKRLLKKGVKVVEFCEPCDDAKPGEAYVVDTLEIKPWSDPPDKTVLINGKEVDLAYLFVERSPGDGHFVNVAKQVGCPATDVSAEIDPRHPPKPQRPPR